MPLASKNEAEVVTAVERRLSRLSEQTRVKLLKAWLDGSKVMVQTEKPVDHTVEFRDALERISQLERALGRKTLENELLREAIDLTKFKATDLLHGQPESLAVGTLAQRRFAPANGSVI